MAASFSLIIEDDAGKQIVVPFAKPVITIGRKEGNTIRLTERNVSRFHAKLEKNEVGVLVEDLSSFNGVKLNGDRIAGKVQVTAGDVIEIGDYHLELRAALAAKAAVGSGLVGSKAAAVQEAPASSADEFEGDTQRWEGPPAAAPVLVGSLALEDQRADSSASGGFAEGQGDTERFDLLQAAVSLGRSVLPPSAVLGEPHSWPPPSPRAAVAPPPAMAMSADAEPTVPQPIANIAFGLAAPPPAEISAPPTSKPSSLLAEPTEDMRPPRMPEAPVRKAATKETEQVRPGVANPVDELAIPRLVVLNTIFAGSSFPLTGMENVIGRTDENDIVLEHRSVSRNHAKLVREGERVRILDLKSANGVLVNGEEVEQQVLKNGDTLELGRLKIRFVAAGERFVVPADDIERARVQDAAGDDNVDSNTVMVPVTKPLRKRAFEGAAHGSLSNKPLFLYVVLGVLVVVVVFLLIALSMKDKAPGLVVAPQLASPAGELAADVVSPAVVPGVFETPRLPDVQEAPAVQPAQPSQGSARQGAREQRQDSDEVKLPVKKSEAQKTQLKKAQNFLMQANPKEALAILREQEKLDPTNPELQRLLATACTKIPAAPGCQPRR